MAAGEWVMLSDRLPREQLEWPARPRSESQERKLATAPSDREAAAALRELAAAVAAARP